MIIDVLRDFTENYVAEKETKIAKKALKEIRENRVSSILIDLDNKLFEIDSPAFNITEKHCKQYKIKKPKNISQDVFDWLLRNIEKAYNTEFIYKSVRNGKRKRG